MMQKSDDWFRDLDLQQNWKGWRIRRSLWWCWISKLPRGFPVLFLLILIFYIFTYFFVCLCMFFLLSHLCICQIYWSIDLSIYLPICLPIYRSYLFLFDFLVLSDLIFLSFHFLILSYLHSLSSTYVYIYIHIQVLILLMYSFIHVFIGKILIICRIDSSMFLLFLFGGVSPETAKQLDVLGVFPSKAGTSDSATKTCEEQDLNTSTSTSTAILAFVTFLLSWEGYPPPVPYRLSKSHFFKNVKKLKKASAICCFELPLQNGKSP